MLLLLIPSLLLLRIPSLLLLHLLRIGILPRELRPPRHRRMELRPLALQLRHVALRLARVDGALALQLWTVGRGGALAVEFWRGGSVAVAMGGCGRACAVEL